MRSDDSTATNAKVLDANEYIFKFETDSQIKGNFHCREATDVVMHKDSKFFQSWQKFKDNNQFVTSKHFSTCFSLNSKVFFFLLKNFSI